MAWTGSPGAAAVRPGSPEDQAEKQRVMAQQHQALSGVNPGGAGYVSGQVNPNPQPTAAVSAPGTVSAGGPPAAPGQGWRAGVPASVAPPQQQLPAFGIGAGFGLPALGAQTQTQTSALTAPGGGYSAPPATGAGRRRPMGPAGTTDVGGTGTGEGWGMPGLSSVPIVGDMFSTSTADLGPVHAAQNADFALGSSLNQERYNYRPGEAPYQERVQLDTAQADQTRAQQEQAIAALTAASNGTVPSAAELQLREQAAHNNANAFGAAQALRGRSPGGSYLAASRQNATNQLSTNATAAMMRAAEQERARNALTEALGGVRTQDIGTANANANLGQAANANNLTAQTQANAQAQDWRQQLLQGQLAAMGYGTQAATGGANAAAANAKAENEGKNKFINAAASFL